MGGQLCKRKLEQQSQMSQYVRRGDWPFVLPISCYHLCLPSITWCAATNHVTSSSQYWGLKLATGRRTNFTPTIWFSTSEQYHAFWNGQASLKFSIIWFRYSLSCRNLSCSLAGHYFLIPPILLMVPSHDRTSQYAPSPQNCTTTPHQQVAGVHPLLFVLFITIMPLMYGDISHKSREYLCQYLVKGWKWWYQNLSEAQFISKFIPP